MRVLPPIPYESRTLLVLVRRREAVDLLRQSERIAQEVGVPIPDVQQARSKLPNDPVSLRGIPIQGRGIGGAIRGTRPDQVQ